jgi:prepilin-type N-terminal cleavage/methylation domain-containing protein
MSKGFTLLEVTIAMVVILTITGLAFPRISGTFDQIATDRAVSEVLSFYHDARLSAIWRSTAVEIEFGQDTLRATFRGLVDSLFVTAPGPRAHGVQMVVSRKKIRIYPTGIGWGAANTKLVFTRGAAAESLTTSRLGRVKRW